MAKELNVITVFSWTMSDAVITRDDAIKSGKGTGECTTKTCGISGKDEVPVAKLPLCDPWSPALHYQLEASSPAERLSTQRAT